MDKATLVKVEEMIRYTIARHTVELEPRKKWVGESLENTCRRAVIGSLDIIANEVHKWQE